jgi:hypothetical protein
MSTAARGPETEPISLNLPPQEVSRPMSRGERFARTLGGRIVALAGITIAASFAIASVSGIGIAPALIGIGAGLGLVELGRRIHEPAQDALFGEDTRGRSGIRKYGGYLVETGFLAAGSQALVAGAFGYAALNLAIFTGAYIWNNRSRPAIEEAFQEGRAGYTSADSSRRADGSWVAPTAA